MHYTIKAAAAVALLNLVPSISGHACFLQAIGDSGGSGVALGIIDDTPRYDQKQIPFQADIAVFSSPAVPWKKPYCKNKKCCKAKNCYAKAYYKAVKRQYNANGCGVTLHNLDVYAKSKWPDAFAKANNWDKNVKWYQQPVPAEGYINVNNEITSLAKQGRITKACAGGWIKAQIHQLNTDGAGAYKCKLDTGATANSWDGGWLKITANIKWWKKNYNNVPGNKYSVNGLKLKDWNIVIHLPQNLDCKGSIGGVDNVCLIRCENSAKNGPFGGCIPFQQVRGGRATQVATTLIQTVKGDPVTVTSVVTTTLQATPAPEPTDVTVGGDNGNPPADTDDGDKDDSEYGNSYDSSSDDAAADAAADAPDA
ncbi:hypothetical protein H072_10195 [Dactylellina haptotyla CBS 200.50]|uniref:Uncharacterized protein n=1 Tax=Dactylellina haptotyla (strain CBS 200.50) TaxID=1284197 RepID=S8BAW7_DACHA|nr:hypothetical protein H072_10195 [Dactylellina haptotyla CBS 200.50]